MRKRIGQFLLLLALAIVVWEGFAFAEFGEWRLFVFGEIFFRLIPEWLNLAQAVIQRYLHPWIWDPAIQSFLLWPAWPVLGGLGAGLYLWGRRRR